MMEAPVPVRGRWVFIAAPVVFVVSALLISLTFAFQSEGPISRDITKAGRVASPLGGSGPKADPAFVSAHGIVEPAQPEARLAADTPGRISAIFVSEGDHVEKGAVLAEIENQTLKAHVRAAEASLAEAKAELTRAMHGMVATDVNAIVYESDAAQAKAKLAESDLARSIDLAKNGSIANAELEQVRQRYDGANAEYAAAAARAISARGGSRREDILVAEARVRAAEARRDEAKAALARSLIIAPLTGDILRVKARIGEYHNPSSPEPMLVMGDTQTLRVRFDVDERDVSRIRVGAPGYVKASAFGEERFPGKVVEVARRMGRRTVRVDDPADRVDVKILEVVFALDGKTHLIPGQRVEGFVGPLS